MSAGAVNGLTSEKIYDPALYETAAEGSACPKPSISTESTNVIMHILGELVIGPLSRIPDLAQQVEKGAIDQEAAQKVETIFRSVGFVPSTAKGQPLSGEKKDLALRTANLFRSEYFDSWSDLLADYLIHFRNMSEDDAFRNVLSTATGGSLSATIGERALDVFKADLLIQKARQAAAKERQIKADERAVKADERAVKADERAVKADERLKTVELKMAALGYLCGFSDGRGGRIKTSLSKASAEIHRIFQNS